MLCMYATCCLFVFVVLGLICRYNGFGIWPFLRYIREDVLIVPGTSTSESVLPRIMLKLEKLGCAKPVVGLVIPTGYSFNLDGTSIYLLVGIDRFMAEARSITNIIGNSVATVVIAQWEGALDVERMRRMLSGQQVEDQNEQPAPAGDLAQAG